ncbi:S-layer homology domain-containing protein [Phosphitispora fastidiosa]|uniref:S-layer homology domain-containing protein n=1 Tax=Phosphitispora fastidiosa TaxID=2837202 RepID=UPI001E33943E|nr:S-layer homology domain-containing protein [Phosphitispora fastidiosa]MBU7006029.1 hypothetical protein [Phosphitispora fastidiosa]
MKGKTISRGLLITVMILSMLAVMSATVLAVPADVCEIDGTGYSTLDDALAAVEDGETATITLLQNIDYESGTGISVINKNITFDLGTYTLNLGLFHTDPVLEAGSGGVVDIIDTDGGFLNIAGGYRGVYAHDGGTVTVSGISGIYGYGVAADSGSSVTVKGNISAMNNVGTGLLVNSGASVHVEGSVQSLTGIGVHGTDTSVTIDGDVSASNGTGASVSAGANLTVAGNIQGAYKGITAYGTNGGTAHIEGTVTASNNLGVEASGGSNVTIDGDVTSKNGIYAYGEGTSVFIKNNTTSTGATAAGATALGGGQITIDGTITANTYIQVGELTKDGSAGSRTEPTTKSGYYTYTDDGTNMVWVKIDTCLLSDCGLSDDEGGFTEYTDIDGERYYHVANGKQLAHINDHLDLNFIQTADIDLAVDFAGGWNPIGGIVDGDQSTDDDEFRGKYLGNGHTIDNLYIEYAGPEAVHIQVGLFARITGEESLVEDLNVIINGINTENYGSAKVGAIVGTIDDGSIRNCSVTFDGNIVTDCPNGSTGGIAGGSYFGEIDNCSVVFSGGSIITDGWDKYAGGIVGQCMSSVKNCEVTIGAGQKIKAPAVGGIAGSLSKMKYFDKVVENCTVTGEGSLEIFPQQYYPVYIGGIAGTMWEGEIQDCRNEVAIIADVIKIAEGQSAYAGGTVGYAGSNSTVYGCTNTGDVELEIADNIVTSYDDPGVSEGNEYAYAGGIAGYINGYSRASIIENCANDANITSINNIPTLRAYAGGIAGHLDCGDGQDAGLIIRTSANMGADKTVSAVAGTTLTGGLVGSTTFTDFTTPNIIIENSYNRSNVSSASNSAPKTGTMCIGITAGGVVGAAGEVNLNYTYSTAADVTAVNNHEGDAYAGGITGVIYNTSLTQNYYEANENVTKAVGGKVNTTDIIYESDVPDMYSGATAEQLKTKTFYGSGWKWYVSGGTAPDYYSSSDPWRITTSDGYPVLKGAPYTPPSSGGGGSAPVPVKVTTETTDNITTTKTEISKAASGGEVTVEISPAIVDALIKKASDEGAVSKGDTIAVVIKPSADINRLNAEIGQPQLERIARETDAGFGITSPLLSITFDNKAIETISDAAEGGNITISAGIIDETTLSEKDRAKVAGRPVYDLSVKNGDVQVSHFGGGHATVRIPYTLKPGENPNAVVIYYLSDDGNLKVVRGHFDAAAGAVVFKTSHFSNFVIGHNPVTFSDVRAGAWYIDAVDFIAARGITSGTGDGKYGPEIRLTRGQFMVLLMNAYQIDPASGEITGNFADAGNTYYTSYLAAAKSLGIANGVGNNMFAPDKEITRQEMFVLLYNALQLIDELPPAITDKELGSFSDADSVASWASEAMSALVKGGIVSGSDNMLSPAETTTRAQMAQVLYNLLAK